MKIGSYALRHTRHHFSLAACQLRKSWSFYNEIQTLILGATALALTLLFFALPAFHDWGLNIFSLFKDPQAMREYIVSYGVLAPIISARFSYYFCKRLVVRCMLGCRIVVE